MKISQIFLQYNENFETLMGCQNDPKCHKSEITYVCEHKKCARIYVINKKVRIRVEPKHFVIELSGKVLQNHFHIFATIACENIRKY